MDNGSPHLQYLGCIGRQGGEDSPAAGVGKVKRNDVLVFNFPYPAKQDSLAMDIMLYYVKRCIALPGDTLEIRNGFYRIRGTEEELGNIAAQRRISGLTENNLRGVVMESFPWSKRLGWTIKEFGPLPVPGRSRWYHWIAPQYYFINIS